MNNRPSRTPGLPGTLVVLALALAFTIMGLVNVDSLPLRVLLGAGAVLLVAGIGLAIALPRRSRGSDPSGSG